MVKKQTDSNNILWIIPQFPIELDKNNNEWKKLLDVTGITIYGENVLVKNVKLKKIKNSFKKYTILIINRFYSYFFKNNKVKQQNKVKFILNL